MRLLPPTRLLRPDRVPRRLLLPRQHLRPHQVRRRLLLSAPVLHAPAVPVRLQVSGGRREQDAVRPALLLPDGRRRQPDAVPDRLCLPGHGHVQPEAVPARVLGVVRRQGPLRPVHRRPLLPQRHLHAALPAGHLLPGRVVRAHPLPARVLLPPGRRRPKAVRCRDVPGQLRGVILQALQDVQDHRQHLLPRPEPRQPAAPRVGLGGRGRARPARHRRAIGAGPDRAAEDRRAGRGALLGGVAGRHVRDRAGDSAGGDIGQGGGGGGRGPVIATAGECRGRQRGRPARGCFSEDAILDGPLAPPCRVTSSKSREERSLFGVGSSQIYQTESDRSSLPARRQTRHIVNPPLSPASPQGRFISNLSNGIWREAQGLLKTLGG